jgi:uncharacterized protein
MRGGRSPFASRGEAPPRAVGFLSPVSVGCSASGAVLAPSGHASAVLRVRFFAITVLAVVIIIMSTITSIHASGSASGDALIAATRRGDVAQVRQLLEGGAPVDHRDARGRTALLITTEGDNVPLARLLIASGADVNAKDDIADSPYLLAGARGRLGVLQLTLAHGADLKSVNRFGGTALIPAAHYGHVDAVRMLLAAGVDPDHVNRLGWTALLEAIILGDGGPRHTEIVRLLIAGRASVNLPDAQGVSPLAHARARDQAAIASLLVAAGAR